jgi:hypothetical protein
MKKTLDPNIKFMIMNEEYAYIRILTEMSAATCSRWFFALGFFCPEDGGDTFLRNVGSHKIYTAPHAENGIHHNYHLYRGVQEAVPEQPLQFIISPMLNAHLLSRARTFGPSKSAVARP